MICPRKEMFADTVRILYFGAMQVVVDLPESLVQRISGGTDNISHQVRKALVLNAYLSGELTRGQIAELLGMNFYQVEKWFAEKGIARNYDVADLEEDRKTLDAIVPAP